jgi:toxin ParE1/3/4
LDNLYAHVANEAGVARADAFVGDIVADCMSLSTFPERGARRDHIRPNLRVKAYKRRVSIAFSVDGESAAVVIHGVFYRGQDLERLLRDEES